MAINLPELRYGPELQLPLSQRRQLGRALIGDASGFRHRVPGRKSLAVPTFAASGIGWHGLRLATRVTAEHGRGPRDGDDSFQRTLACHQRCGGAGDTRLVAAGPVRDSQEVGRRVSRLGYY